MYEHCLYCHGALGQNDELEHLPTGRRIAFDPRKGRIWAVCPRCGRWNLVPLLERWEAIEDAERLYRDSPRRVATENVGLAARPSGLELVALGRPRLREFAAWRLGGRLIQRALHHRRVRVRQGAIVGGVAGATGVALAAAGLPFVLPAAAVALGAAGVTEYRRSRPDPLVARVPGQGDDWLSLRRKDLPDVRFDPSHVRQDWRLRLIGRPREGELKELHDLDPGTGQASLSLLMPALNRFGGREREVEEAIRFVERHDSPDALYHAAATLDGYARAAPVYTLPTPVRLALEISAAEAEERRAARGELQFYERAWREADQIAAIADALLVPDSVERAFHALKG